MRVGISGRPHLEQGGLRLSTNLYFGGSAIALNGLFVREATQFCGWNDTGDPDLGRRVVFPQTHEAI
jgi:hypothetical protein